MQMATCSPCAGVKITGTVWTLRWSSICTTEASFAWKWIIRISAGASHPRMSNERFNCKSEKRSWTQTGGGEASLLWHMLGFKYLALNTANTLKDLNILANCNLLNWESHVNCVHLSSIGWSVVSLQLPEPGVATLLTPVPDVKPNWCHFNKPLLV